MSKDNMQQDSATFEVTLKVTYDLDGESPNLLRKQLDYAIRRLAGDGLLSGDTMATVDEWSYRITEGPADTPPDGESATVRDQLADLARSMLAALKKRQGVKAHLADVQEALAQTVGLGTWRTIAALKGQAVAAQALPETPHDQVQALLDAAQLVVNTADDTGCSDDLTVTSAEAVDALSTALSALSEQKQGEQIGGSRDEIPDLEVQVLDPHSKAWETWHISQNLTDRWGDVNYASAEVKPLAELESTPGLLERLREQMTEEITFVARKDGRWGLLFEVEFASIESESPHDEAAHDLYKPHADVVQALLKGLATLSASYPGVAFAVPDEAQICNDRPAVWAFMPDGLLDDAHRQSLARALLDL